MNGAGVSRHPMAENANPLRVGTAGGSGDGLAVRQIRPPDNTTSAEDQRTSPARVYPARSIKPKRNRATKVEVERRRKCLIEIIAEMHPERFSQSFNFECERLHYHATVSYFPGTTNLAEIFLTNSKPSSQSDVNARDSAIAASLALQFGCPIDVLRRALLRDSSGRAASPLGTALDLVERKP
jgi:hypothetical protein